MDTLKWGKPFGLPLFFGFILKTILSFMCKHLPFQMYTIMVMQQGNTVRLQNFYVARLESDNMATTIFLFSRFVRNKADGGIKIAKIGVEIEYPDRLDSFVSRSHAILDYFRARLNEYGLYIVWVNSWFTSCEVSTSQDANHGASLDVVWLDDSKDASMVNLDDFCEAVKTYLG